MDYLSFDISDDADGVTTLEAMASTSAGQHAAVMAEVQQVLAWAWRTFPHTHVGADDDLGIGLGKDWDHDLQVQVEDGHWHTVTLTLSGSPGFVAAFFDAFGDPQG